MFLSRKNLSAVLFTLALLCFPSILTKADTVVITSGFSTFSESTSSGRVVLNGSGFGLTGGLSIVLGNAGAAECYPSCGNRTSVNLSAGFDSQGGISVSNPFTLGGVQYTAAFGSLNTVNGANFNLGLSAPVVTLPPLGAFSTLEITAPFDARGGLSSNANPLAFPTTTLIGQGTVVFRLRADHLNGEYDYESITYTFGPRAPGVTVAAIPEPTTLLLLGTGLAGVVAKVRKGKKTQKNDEA